MIEWLDKMPADFALKLCAFTIMFFVGVDYILKWILKIVRIRKAYKPGGDLFIIEE